MSDYYENLAERVQQRLGDRIDAAHVAFGELTIEVAPEQLIAVATQLRDDKEFAFEELIDVAGVDYSEYPGHEGGRFAAVYHLLSVSNNHRIRLRSFCPDDAFPVLPTITGVWNGADWFEREAFDLFGILFEGHHDLRRILTDYGFIGHPFRKDFPLSGNVEMRYDPEKGRVVYEPVSIEPRSLVPRVTRDDNRYVGEEG